VCSTGHVRAAVTAVLLALGLLGFAAGPGAATAWAASDDSGSSGAASAERSAVAVVNEFWRRTFAASGEQYKPPRVVGDYTGKGPRCGGRPAAADNAFYCRGGDFLAWDKNLMASGYREIGDGWVYLVVAHEWGHAVQARLARSQVSVAAELQADCLAGASLQGAADKGLVDIEPGDSDEITRGLTVAADDSPWTDASSHGDASQRVSAFSDGVHGGVDACL
jgi:predicted metalloprotease